MALPLTSKYYVFTIFCQFKILVENYFKTKIVSIHSDGGSEYIALKEFLANLGIQHLKMPPHTPQHNGTSESQQKHIVNIVLTLIHKANLLHRYWSHVF